MLELQATELDTSVFGHYPALGVAGGTMPGKAAPPAPNVNAFLRLSALKNFYSLLMGLTAQLDGKCHSFIIPTDPM